MSLRVTTDSAAPAPTGSRARRVWGWVGLIVTVIIIGSALSALQRDWTAPAPFDAESPRYDGALAVTKLLASEGIKVDVTDGLDEARAHASEGATVVVTDARILTPEALRRLVEVATRTVILRTDYAAVDSIFPGIGFGGYGGADPVAPGCSLPAAEHAGAIIPGEAYTVEGDVTGCYPVEDGHALLEVPVDQDSTVTLLDGRATFVNENLADEGNAALALGLLAQGDSIVWYSPSPGDAGSDAPVVIGDLVPTWVTPAIFLAAFAAAAAAVWRGRRFGPLVAETLPVTVRAGETLEGRARLYRAAEDPAHALDVLRRGAVARMSRRLGLAAGADVQQVSGALAAILGHDPNAVHDTLTATPATDSDLAELGRRLRDLEYALDETNPWEGRSR